MAAQSGDAQDAQLFSQTASAALERQFGTGNVSWLLLDGAGRVLAQRWSAANLPVAPGSLVKPFVALAYGEQHHFAFPRIHCAGKQSRCWLPQGHGWIGIDEAIGQSCNAYFLALVAGLDRDRASESFARFGLHGPPRTAPGKSLIGLGDDWKETPLTIARAYLALVREQASQQGDEIVAKGMRTAAETGTAREVDAELGAGSAFAKTGTAACSHQQRAAADGFAVVLYPAVQPRVLLLVREHGTTGAQAAAVAGAMLKAIGEGAP